MKQKIFPLKVEQKTFTDKTTHEKRDYIVYSVVTSKTDVPVKSTSNLGTKVLAEYAGTAEMRFVATYKEFKDKDTEEVRNYWAFEIEVVGEELFIDVKASETLGRKLIVRDCEQC